MTVQEMEDILKMLTETPCDECPLHFRYECNTYHAHNSKEPDNYCEYLAKKLEREFGVTE